MPASCMLAVHRTRLLSLLAATALAAAAAAQSGSSAKADALHVQAQTLKRQAWVLAGQKGYPRRVELPDGSVFELIRMRYGRPAYYQTLGFDGADTVGADELWPGGGGGFSLSGAGVVLGEWDAGNADKTHREFTSNGVSRILYSDAATSVQTHSTHVAGIMTATGLTAAAKGMAYEASVKSYDWTDDFSEMTAAAQAGLLASNHSYGYVCGWSNNLLGDGRWAWLGDSSISATTDFQFGFYSDETRTLDGLLYDNPHYLAVWAAGNSRFGGPSSQPILHDEYNPATDSWFTTSAVRDKNGGASGYDTLTIGPPVSKNDLAIAAVNSIPGGYKSPSDVVVASFSSAGPTDDGRVKPDLASPGVNIYSTLPGNSYGTMSGTSMATPGVTGVVGLLAQQYRLLFNADPLAATMKALLIQTADAATTAPGPNYRTGWGLVDALSAGKLLASEAARHDVVYEGTLHGGETLSLPVMSDGSAPLKATLVWTDPAGTAGGAALDDRTPKLVNDLDLRIAGGATTYRPWTLDPNNPANAAVPGDNVRDNVEQVLVATPSAGGYTVSISAKNATLAPSGAQNFTLIVTGHRLDRVASVVLNPSTVVGDGAHASTGTVTLEVPAPKNGAVVALGSSGSGVSVPASITIPSGAKTGTFTANVAATSADAGVTISATYNGASSTASLVVQAPRSDAAFVSQTVPTRLSTGQSTVVDITMKNTGNVPWKVTSQTGYCLISQNPLGNVTWGADRAWIPDAAPTVMPGASYTFHFGIKAPATPGTYNFQWQMRQSGVGQFGSLTPNVAIQVGGVNDATFVSQTVPDGVRAGQRFTASVTFQNTGSTTWKTADNSNYCVISQGPLDNATWGVSRIWVPDGAAVAPGSSYTFTYTFTAPSTPGNYNFQWQMRQSGVGQFGTLGTAKSIAVTP